MRRGIIASGRTTQIGTPVWGASTVVNTLATTSATTASFTPGANSVVLLMLSGVWDYQPASSPTFSVSNTGFGTLTTGWTQLARDSVPMDGATNFDVIREVWACKVGASPTSGTVTVTRQAGTYQAANQMFWIIAGSVTNAAIPASPNSATMHVVPSTLSGTLTFATAPSSASLVVAVTTCLAFSAPTVTQPAGWTEVVDENNAAFNGTNELAQKVGSAAASTSWSWAGNGNGVYTLAVEIPAA